MDVVSKKKPPPEPAITPPEPPPDSLLVRLPEPQLAFALDEYARRTRRSRNLAIVVILEEAMKEAGLWPPPEPDD